MTVERLQKVIAARGLASRRQAELMIVQGRVKVNGILVTELGTKVDPLTDEIQVDGKLLSARKEPLYLLLYKPIGYVTTMSDPQHRPIVSDLLTGIDTRLYPVGRLDYYSSGLLLCTNDGELAHRMMHPRYKLTKYYRVTVTGRISEADLADNNFPSTWISSVRGSTLVPNSVTNIPLTLTRPWTIINSACLREAKPRAAITFWSLSTVIIPTGQSLSVQQRQLYIGIQIAKGINIRQAG